MFSYSTMQKFCVGLVFINILIQYLEHSECYYYQFKIFKNKRAFILYLQSKYAYNAPPWGESTQKVM